MHNFLHTIKRLVLISVRTCYALFESISAAALDAKLTSRASGVMNCSHSGLTHNFSRHSSARVTTFSPNVSLRLPPFAARPKAAPSPPPPPPAPLPFAGLSEWTIRRLLKAPATVLFPSPPPLPTPPLALLPTRNRPSGDGDDTGADADSGQEDDDSADDSRACRLLPVIVLLLLLLLLSAASAVLEAA